MNNILYYSKIVHVTQCIIIAFQILQAIRNYIVLNNELPYVHKSWELITKYPATEL